jgi:hypothetical protein
LSIIINFITFRYHLKEPEAALFSGFLLPMLEFCPETRITAQKSLTSQWLKAKTESECKMNENEFQSFLKKSELAQKNHEDVKNDDNSSNKEDVDSDRHDADQEDYGLISEDPLSEDGIDFDRRFLDRSFANQKYGYIGYGDGIQLEELDIKGNWQFD